MRYDHERRMTHRRKNGQNHPLRRFVGRNKDMVEVEEERKSGERRQRFEESYEI